MPYENYLTEEDFRSRCDFWGAIENKLNEKFQPNPWIFNVGYRLYPQTHEYALTYQTFDGSKHLSFFVAYDRSGLRFTNCKIF